MLTLAKRPLGGRVSRRAHAGTRSTARDEARPPAVPEGPREGRAQPCRPPQAAWRSQMHAAKRQRRAGEPDRAAALGRGFGAPRGWPGQAGRRSQDRGIHARPCRPTCSNRYL